MTQAPASRQDDLYREAAGAFGDGLERLAHAYEADPDTRRDLLQDIHLALWRSFAGYDGRCSQRTWVYRVAHNTAASHVTRWVRLRRLQLTTLEEADGLADGAADGLDAALEKTLARERLLRLIRRLDALDRQVIVLVPRRHGRGGDRGDHGTLRRRRRHESAPHQAHPRALVSHGRDR